MRYTLLLLFASAYLNAAESPRDFWMKYRSAVTADTPSDIETLTDDPRSWILHLPAFEVPEHTQVKITQLDDGWLFDEQIGKVKLYVKTDRDLNVDMSYALSVYLETVKNLAKFATFYTITGQASQMKRLVLQPDLLEDMDRTPSGEDGHIANLVGGAPYRVYSIAKGHITCGVLFGKREFRYRIVRRDGTWLIDNTDHADK